MENEDRISRLLALILINQMGKGKLKEKAVQLNIAGFTNIEIANLLDSTAASISQFLYEAKKKKGKASPKSSSKKKSN